MLLHIRFPGDNTAKSDVDLIGALVTVNAKVFVSKVWSPRSGWWFPVWLSIQH